jgi:hypothetical protein
MVALGLLGCQNGLDLTIDLQSGSFNVDEVRVRLDVEHRNFGSDLGGVEGPSQQSGAVITPGKGNTVISFPYSLFNNTNELETILQPEPSQATSVAIAGGLFKNGGWVGGGPLVTHAYISTENRYSVQLTLGCDVPGRCQPVAVFDLAAPPTEPKIAVAPAKGNNPLSVLAVASLTVPGAATAIVSDSLNVMLYPPLVGQPFPDTLAPATSIIGKFGEPLTGALAADVDGDGQTDLILSSPAARGGAGVVYIFYAPKIPTGAVFDLNTDLNYAETVRIVGDPGDGFGAMLAAVPPDAFSTTSASLLAVGVPNHGLVYVFAPPSSGESPARTTARATIDGAGTYGGALAAGVFERSTLLIGAPSQNAVYPIAASLLNGPINVTQMFRLSGSGRFGAALAVGMGGGGPVFAVGAPDADTAFIFNSPAITQSTGTPWKTFSGPAGSGFGSAIALSEADDWYAIGAPLASPFGKLGGGEVVIFNGHRLRPATPNVVSDAVQLVWPEADGDRLGAQLAFGNYDTSSTKQQLFIGATKMPGAFYGIQSLLLP